MKLDRHETSPHDGKLVAVPRRTPPGVLLEPTFKTAPSGPSLTEINETLQRHKGMAEHYTGLAAKETARAKKAKEVVRASKALLSKLGKGSETNRAALLHKISEAERDIAYAETKRPAWLKIVEHHKAEGAAYAALYADRKVELEEDARLRAELSEAINE